MRDTDITPRAWGHAIVVDPRELERLRAEHAWASAAGMRLRRLLPVLGAVVVLSTGVAVWATVRADHLTRELHDARRHVSRSSIALSTLARSHESMLAATQAAPSVGTKSWGRRFTVTMYLPRSEAYGRFNDGMTATLTKADPRSRLVAVDPKLIPYGSWLWIEGLGWFRAEDCGSAIKGFRLDVLVATESEAMRFGKQDRFVIVVPPTNA